MSLDSAPALGALGSGTAAKATNNGPAHAVMVVLVETGEIGATTGVHGDERAARRRAPDTGLPRPLTHRVVERVLGGEYDGGMPPIAARTDSTLAVTPAPRSALPRHVIRGAHTVYEPAAGYGRVDQPVDERGESSTVRSLSLPLDEAVHG